MDFMSYRELTRFSLKIGCDGRVNGEKSGVSRMVKENRRIR